MLPLQKRLRALLFLPGMESDTPRGPAVGVHTPLLGITPFPILPELPYRAANRR